MSLTERLGRIERQLEVERTANQGECHCGRLWLEVRDAAGNVPADVETCPQCGKRRGMVLIVDTDLVASPG